MMDHATISSFTFNTSHDSIVLVMEWKTSGWWNEVHGDIISAMT